MTLRFCDSFDHYVTADVLEKWTSHPGGAGTISAGNGRHGSACFRCTSNVSGGRKTLDAQATWIIGVAVKVVGFAGGIAPLIALYDGGTMQCSVTLDPAGTLAVMRGASTPVTNGSALKALRLDVWHYLEWKVTIANSIGASTCQVRVDGVVMITVATGQDLQSTANASANMIQLVGANSIDFDDLYICDGQGSVNNDFLGDVRVDALLPNGEGSNSAWTCSTGTTHYSLVDEAAPNDDTDYLSSATATQRDSHAMAALPSMNSPVIKGVMLSASAKKDDAGARQIKNLVKSGATTQAGSTAHSLASSYAYYSEVFETDPDTAAAWTESGLNAIEAGVECVA
jgi:hypothetical protein